MKYIKYKYNIKINNINMLLIKRNEIKNPFSLINKKILIENFKLEKKIRIIEGIEILTLYMYSKKIDKELTGGYYSGYKKIDYKNLKKDLNSYDNKLVILKLKVNI